jgi:hypothetical protein
MIVIARVPVTSTGSDSAERRFGIGSIVSCAFGGHSGETFEHANGSWLLSAPPGRKTAIEGLHCRR